MNPAEIQALVAMAPPGTRVTVLVFETPEHPDSAASSVMAIVAGTDAAPQSRAPGGQRDTLLAIAQLSEAEGPADAVNLTHVIAARQTPFTSAELADLLRVKRRTVSRWCRTQVLTGVTKIPGAGWRIPPSSVITMLAGSPLPSTDRSSARAARAVEATVPLDMTSGRAAASIAADTPNSSDLAGAESVAGAGGSAADESGARAHRAAVSDPHGAIVAVRVNGETHATDGGRQDVARDASRARVGVCPDATAAMRDASGTGPSSRAEQRDRSAVARLRRGDETGAPRDAVADQASAARTPESRSRSGGTVPTDPDDEPAPTQSEIRSTIVSQYDATGAARLLPIIKCVTQRSDSDCGVAALAMLLSLPYDVVAEAALACELPRASIHKGRRTNAGHRMPGGNGLTSREIVRTAAALGQRVRRRDVDLASVERSTGVLGIDLPDGSGHWAMLAGTLLFDTNGCVWSTRAFLRAFRAQPVDLLEWTGRIALQGADSSRTVVP